MDDESIQLVVDELDPLLTGRAPGKIFQFGVNSLAIDFGFRSEGYLYISCDPSLPRIHLVKRKVRDLERQSTPHNQFALRLRKELAGTTARSVRKDIADRIVRINFDGMDELGESKQRVLVVQLSGRSANLFLIDADQKIMQAARLTTNEGQQTGDTYAAPRSYAASQTKSTALQQQIRSHQFPSTSAAADAYYNGLLFRREFEAQAQTARSEMRKQVSQQEKLLKQLESDLQQHVDAAEQKRIGDLLLANLSTAKRRGQRVTLIDYFSDGAKQVEIELDESTSIQQEAQRRFAAYQRSKRATAQISARIQEIKDHLKDLRKEQEKLEEQLAKTKAASLESGITSATSKVPLRKTAPHKVSAGQKIPGTRRYLSSDGFEILVGRTSKDNDHLTTKIAKPNDVWLHAADYGGSHVVIRNSTRKDVPHRTLIEAAQLAAYFSQAKKDPKVDVNYTQRKFVAKPKGSKPGLVRLQRFKSITVAPHEAGVRQ